MIKRPLLVITVVLIFGAVYLKYNEAGKIGRLFFPLPLFVSELEKAGGSMERTMAGEVYRIDPYEEGAAILLKTGPREMIRVILKGDLRPEAGERIRISGKLRLFREATNPGQFDLRAYYRNLDIHAGLQTEVWEQLEPSRNRILEAVTRIRFALLSVIEKNSLPEDRGIFKSLILKVSGSYDREETDDLSRYGFLFLVSFSGIHVTCLAAAVYRVLRKLLEKYGAFFGLAFFLFFLCGLSGFSASVKRACLVSGIRGLAPVCRRKFDYLSAAALSLLILIVSLPGIIFTTSFQYMAAAASAVGLFYPALRKQLPYRRTKDKGTLFMRRLLEGIFFSLTLQVFLLPVKLWHQFSFSPYALFSGALSAALLPLQLFSLFPGAAAGLIRPELSSFFFGTGHYIYRGITGLSEGIGRLPWAVFINGRPPAKTVAVYYLFLLMILMVFRIRTEKEKSREIVAGKTAPLSKERKRERRLRGALLILMFAVYGAGILFLRAERLPGSCLRITHADTGQGDCVIIEADGKVVVSDCGSADMNDPGKDVLVPLLMSRGIDHVDALFLSHGDRDHVNGTASLLKRMPVDTVFLPDLKKLSEEYSTVLPEIEAAGAAVAIVSRGDTVVFGTGQSFSGASGTSSGAPQNVYDTEKNASGGSRAMSGELVFHFLWPEKNSVITGNDASLTAAVSYETFTGLLTGDISSDMEGAIDFPDHITWLKTAHHGSKYSTSRDFLRKTAPLTATAGAERRNVYGHPAEETREWFRDAGTAFFCTADCGAVTVTFRNDTVQVKTFLDNKAGK